LERGFSALSNKYWVGGFFINSMGGDGGAGQFVGVWVAQPVIIMAQSNNLSFIFPLAIVSD